MVPKNFYQKANEKLAEVVKATSENGFLYVDEKTGSYLEGKGLVERNLEIVNDAGEIATRATEAGIAKCPVEKEKQVMAISSFVIENIPVAKPARAGNKKSGIPFDQLEVGQSIFFADDGTDPKFLAKMRLRAYGATNKFAVPEMDAEGKTVMRQIKRGPNAGTEVPQMVITREFVADRAERDNGAGVMEKGVRLGRLK